jgi:hypothetical protein
MSKLGGFVSLWRKKTCRSGLKYITTNLHHCCKCDFVLIRGFLLSKSCIVFYKWHIRSTNLSIQLLIALLWFSHP